MRFGVVLLLAVLWGSILVPDLASARRRLSPATSVSEFSQKMSLLAPEALSRQPELHRPRPGRKVLVVTDPVHLMGGPRRANLVRRRRLLLFRLAVAVLVAAVVAIIFGGITTWIAGFLGAVLAAYVVLLRTQAAHTAHTRRTVRRLPTARSRAPRQPTRRAAAR